MCAAILRRDGFFEQSLIRGTYLVPRLPINNWVTFLEPDFCDPQPQPIGQPLVDQSGPWTHLGSLTRFSKSIEQGAHGQPALLDLCAGAGGVLAEFADRGWWCSGFEACPLLRAYATQRLADRASLTGVFGELSEDHRFDLVLGFDDFAFEIIDTARLQNVLRLVRGALVDGGTFVFQRERSTGPRCMSVAHAASASGFSRSWRASPSRLEKALPEDLEHHGSRDLFVLIK